MAQAAMEEKAETGGTERLPGALPCPPPGRRPFLRFRPWETAGIWRRGLVVALLALGLGALLLLHARVPNSIGGMGSLLQTFLPWVGLGIPVLLLCALLRRSATALVALVLPTMVWINLFGGLLGDKTGSGGDLIVATHNVSADNPDPTGTARELAASGVDVLALQELTKAAIPRYTRVLDSTYRYRAVQGTVAVWSKYPLSDTRPVDIRLGWTRAMRTTVSAPGGDVGLYIAHLPSVRVKFEAGFTAGQRDDAAGQLGAAISAEPLTRVVLLGDLNGTMNDGALAPVTSQLRSTQGAAGDGFGFSWPASFPLTRIDQIMVKGVEPVSSWTLPATGSDHLPIAASLNL